MLTLIILLLSLSLRAVSADIECTTTLSQRDDLVNWLLSFTECDFWAARYTGLMLLIITVGGWFIQLLHRRVSSLSKVVTDKATAGML